MAYEIIGKYSDAVHDKSGNMFKAIHIIYIDTDEYLMYVFNTYISKTKLTQIEREANFKLDINFEKMIELKPLQSDILDLKGIDSLLRYNSITEKKYNDLKSKLRQLKIGYVIDDGEE